MNNNTKQQERRRHDAGQTAIVVLHLPETARANSPAETLTVEQQREACRRMAAQHGLRIIGEAMAQECDERINPDGFRYYVPDGTDVDVVLHAHQRAVVLPGVVAVGAAAAVEQGSSLWVQLIRLPDET